MAQLGEKPSASDQNDRNATSLDLFEVFTRSRQGSDIFNWYSRGNQVATHPDYWNIALNGLCVGSTNIQIRDYDTNALLLDWDGDADPAVYAPAVVVNVSGGAKQYFVPPGHYKVDVLVDSVPLYPHGTLGGIVGVYLHRGQTDIEEGSMMRLWKSDFSDYEEPTSYESGIPLSLYGTGRLGWEAP